MIARFTLGAVCSLLLFLFFALAGTFSLLAYTSQPLRIEILEYISQGPALYLRGALLLFGLAALVLVLGVFTFGKRYYHLTGKTASVDLRLIRPLIQEAWEGKLALKKISLNPNRRLEILAEMPTNDLEAHEEELSSLEKKIADLLNKKIGYEHSFSLILAPKKCD